MGKAIWLHVGTFQNKLGVRPLWRPSTLAAIRGCTRDPANWLGFLSQTAGECQLGSPPGRRAATASWIKQIVNLT
jgi:hypothetical protein